MATEDKAVVEDMVSRDTVEVVRVGPFAKTCFTTGAAAFSSNYAQRFRAGEGSCVDDGHCQQVGFSMGTFFAPCGDEMKQRKQ